MTIELNGRIDSNNAAQVERAIAEQLTGCTEPSLTLDAKGLHYISSAGLRVLLRVRRSKPDLRIVNVSSEIYEILDMTGFTQMMDVEKAYRVVSIEGCEEIGRGANGKLYRIDQDNVVKVYKHADALADIQHEREMARMALILGIPTAISYDVVKVGDSYGSVFELLNARSFAKILAREPEKIDWCVGEFVNMLKKIHGTEAPAGKLPDMRETAIGWARFMQDYLPAEAGDKLLFLIEAVPRDDHLIHGDYHTKNLELQNDEVLLIDMDTLAVGHPIFELGSMYNSFRGFSELHHEEFEKFQGYAYEIGAAFWHKTLAAYLGTNCETKIREVEDKARVVGYTRLIRRSIRRFGLDNREKRKEIEHWKAELLELLEKTDTLLFSRGELEIEAEPEKLDEVQAFVEEHLASANCSEKARSHIALAVEEIFVNIATYAYKPEKGKATVRVEVAEDPVAVTISFLDQGKPFDPLARETPDVSLSAEEREIGGLGIFMTRKIMDDVSYEYKNGQNILTLKKNLG